MKKMNNFGYALSLSLVVAATWMNVASANRNVKGTIPDAAFASGKVNLSLVPDYVVAYDRQGGVAGYVRKQELFGEHGARPIDHLPVYDDSLGKVVGRMVHGRGFVGAGQADEEVPLFEQASSKTTEALVSGAAVVLSASPAALDAGTK